MKHSKKSNEKNTLPNFNRRQFLAGAGGLALALPPLSSLLLPQIARGQALGKVKRVILIPTFFGCDQNLFFPNIPAGVPATPVAGAVDMVTAPLSAWQGNLSSVLGSAFNDPVLRAKMNVYEGLDVTNNNTIVSHTTGSLAGVSYGQRSPAYGESIDNIIARSPNFYKSTPAFKTLRLSTGADCNQWSFHHDGGSLNLNNDFLMGDKVIYDRLFGNFIGGGVASTPIPDSSRLLTIESAIAKINALKSSRRIAAEDRNLLDRYITSMKELEMKVKANQTAPAPAATCTKPTLALQQTSTGHFYSFPGAFNQYTWGIRSSDALLENYNDLIVNAFLCDLTRVVVIGNEIWQDAPASRLGAFDMFHSHDAGTGGPLTTAQKHAWFLNHIASLAKKLDRIPDPHSDSGSLLDNSVIYFTNEHSGPGASHSCRSIPTLTIGSAGGSFKTGYYIDSRQRPFFDTELTRYRGQSGRPNKQLLISIMEAMGIQRSEYIGKGDGKGFGEFSATDSYTAHGYQKYATTHNDPLPFI